MHDLIPVSIKIGEIVVFRTELRKLFIEIVSLVWLHLVTYLLGHYLGPSKVVFTIQLVVPKNKESLAMLEDILSYIESNGHLIRLSYCS